MCGQTGHWYADIDKATGKFRCPKRKTDTPGQKPSNFAAKKSFGPKKDSNFRSKSFQSRGRSTAMMAVTTTDVSVPERSAVISQSQTINFGLIEDPDYSDNEEPVWTSPGEIPESWYCLCGEPTVEHG